MNKVQILDCTLRDGGYYTNWHFEKNLVQKYAEANSFFNFYNNINPNKIFTITTTKFNIKMYKKSL